MSDNSRSDSYSSQKSRFASFTPRRITKAEATQAIKKRLGQIGDITRNVGANIQSAISSTKEASVFSPANRELDNFGYERYNIDDGMEIFISKVPESAFFNDGEYVNVRATSGDFVGNVDTPSKVEVEAESFVDNPRSLFKGVPVGNSGSTTVHGMAGVVVDGHVEPVSINAETVRPRVVFDSAEPAEAPAAEESAEAPADSSMVVELQEGSDIAIISLGNGVPEESGVSVAVAADDGDGNTEEDIHKEYVFEEERKAAESDDGDWMYQDDLEAQEILRAAEEAEQARAEAAAAYAAAADEPVLQAAAEAPVAEAPAAEAVQETEHIEPAIAETVVPTLGTARIEGLYTEAAEEVSDAVSCAETAAVVSAPTAVTGAEAVMPKSPIEPAVVIKGMDESGSDFLPPMADPVRARPKRAFRFHNGVLQRVDEKKEESDEGLRGPFESTVGQTVRKEPILRIPPVPIEDETDVMRLTIPELDVDEDSFHVAVSGDVIPEDGLEAVCFSPSAGFEEILEETVAETACTETASEEPIASAVPEAEVMMIAPAAEKAFLPAAVPAVAIAPAEIRIALPEAGSEPIPEEEPRAPMPSGHAVTFGFGNGECTGSVCFSF